MLFFQARERRDGENPDYQATDTLSSTANYRAVGPTQEERYLFLSSYFNCFHPYRYFLLSYSI